MIDQKLFDDMTERVHNFIAAFLNSSLYDFGTQDMYAVGARGELSKGVTAYAKGEVPATAVEVLARNYVKACKRPLTPPP